MKYVLRCIVRDVFRQVTRPHISGIGKDAQFGEAYGGWYISLDRIGAVYLGEEQPEFQPGNPVTITIERG